MRLSLSILKIIREKEIRGPESHGISNMHVQSHRKESKIDQSVCQLVIWSVGRSHRQAVGRLDA